MENKYFNVGDHISVYGNKGIITGITHCKEYNISFNGKPLRGNGLEVLTDDAAAATKKNGYTLIETGRTATYFKVDFSNEESLKGTVYDGGEYGCLDDFENYGTW